MGNKEKKLTLKQRKWLEVYLETGNATEAARRVYKCKDDNAAGTIGFENLQKLAVPIGEMMDKMGISTARLMKVLDEGLEANKVELAKYQGEIMDEKAFPDHPTRKTYLEMALKLRGLLRDRLSLEDPDGKPLGPVILPVKECDVKPSDNTGADGN